MENKELEELINKHTTTLKESMEKRLVELAKKIEDSKIQHPEPKPEPKEIDLSNWLCGK